MSRFDTADAMASVEFDRELSDAISFTPTRPLKGGDRITITRGRNTATFEADPEREARPRPGEDFRGIVTWKSFAMGASDVDGTHRDAMMANDVMLDFSRSLFATPEGESFPKSGDIYQVPGSQGATITVQQTRDCYDDGGDRIIVYCIAPTG